ncbi:acyl-CoA synthetase [Streptomyces antimycoticus]|uniref:AMP-dependent synthetase n=1 Tax=Streptomyces antimycoticus TaxID=68175 RepID=A0A4D4KI64_9ACTN|nr:AMP-binding protein [Streptomyces antimycoticus]GDY47854.1 AMP-dependent synthetase [Streptomyces antimycoticus]
MTSPEQRMADLLKTFGEPAANTAYLLCDRHPDDAVAFTVVGKDLTGHDMTYGELRDRSSRMAGALAALGVGVGDRVATLMGKSADLLVASLAIWRLGAVQVPLFTAFAPPAIALRIAGNDTKVVISDADQRPKLDPESGFPGERPWQIVTTGPVTGSDLSFAELAEGDATLPEPVAVGGDGLIVELFTSGTAGTPKAVPIPLRAVAGFAMYQQFGLDHRPTDVFWNAADPGWAYGLYYALIGPLALGQRALLLSGLFSAESTWEVLSRFGVTNFAAGPTVYRKLRASGIPAPGDLRLRCCSAAGEPLPPDVVDWALETLGVPVRDHYGSTELGMVIAHAWHPALRDDIKPGSMGRPLPGWGVKVLREDTNSALARVDIPGRVVVDIEDSPLMWFKGYRDAPEQTAEKFSPDGRWFYTGDTASRDDEGHLFFSGRGDDIILMAGYRIGPFEVETVLLEHAAVAEAAVVGVPDEEYGEVVEAFVVPRPGTEVGDALAAELQQLVRERYAKHAYPRNVHFVAELPKTSSGKTQRFLLRPQQPSPRRR